MHSITIRPATQADVPAMLEIYAPYVRETAISFEYDVPTLQEFSARLDRVRPHHPWLLAEEDGRILGYAYASPFKGRRAYDWAVETSIYVCRDVRGQGIGRLLHDALQAALAQQGILNMCACIAAPHGPEDETLTCASQRFHERLGYRLVGRFSQCGCKFGRWYDMVWMEKHIGPHEENPRPVRLPEEN